jgi:hypothetical protein
MLYQQLGMYTPIKLLESDNLSADAAVAKQLALVAIRSLLSPVIDTKGSDLLPRGLYQLGRSVYRRDTSGIYVLNQDPSLLSEYSVLTPFQHPIHYPMARAENWAQLAEDIL